MSSEEENTKELEDRLRYKYEVESDLEEKLAKVREDVDRLRRQYQALLEEVEEVRRIGEDIDLDTTDYESESTTEETTETTKEPLKEKIANVLTSIKSKLEELKEEGSEESSEASMYDLGIPADLGVSTGLFEREGTLEKTIGKSTLFTKSPFETFEKLMEKPKIKSVLGKKALAFKAIPRMDVLKLESIRTKGALPTKGVLKLSAIPTKGTITLENIPTKPVLSLNNIPTKPALSLDNLITKSSLPSALHDLGLLDFNSNITAFGALSNIHSRLESLLNNNLGEKSILRDLLGLY